MCIYTGGNTDAGAAGADRCVCVCVCIQVATQTREQQELIELYIASSLPPHTASALRRVWTTHPTSLRVKELFETGL